MIYLFVILLHTAAPDAAGEWVDGRYSMTVHAFPTITACETRRRVGIHHAQQQDYRTLISKCATDHDVVEWMSYTKTEAPRPPRSTPSGA